MASPTGRRPAPMPADPRRQDRSGNQWQSVAIGIEDGEGDNCLAPSRRVKAPCPLYQAQPCPPQRQVVGPSLASSEGLVVLRTKA